MDKKDQLTSEEYERVIHVLTLFMCGRLGKKVDINKPYRTIRTKLKKQNDFIKNTLLNIDVMDKETND